MSTSQGPAGDGAEAEQGGSDGGGRRRKGKNTRKAYLQRVKHAAGGREVWGCRGSLLREGIQILPG